MYFYIMYDLTVILHISPSLMFRREKGRKVFDFEIMFVQAGW